MLQRLKSTNDSSRTVNDHAPVQEGFNPAADQANSPSNAIGASRDNLRNLTPARVLSLQRTHGNQYVQRVLAQHRHNSEVKPPPAPPQPQTNPIQRKIGFEFEISSGWATGIPKKPVTPNQKAGTAPLPEPKKVFKKGGLKKGQPLYAGGHFELQADEASAGETDSEFVTTLPPFDETDEGRKQLFDTMLEIHSVTSKMDSRKNEGYIPAGELGPGNVKTPNSGLMPEKRTVKANPQTTLAIRLDQIPKFMEDVGTKYKEKTNTTSYKDRSAGRKDLMGLGDDTIVGQAPQKARDGLAAYLNGHQHTDPPLPNGGLASNELIGLLSLLITYIYRSRLKGMTYAKLLAPIMARTNFVAIFNLVPEKEYFRQKGGDEFVKLVLLCTTNSYAGNPISADADMFPHGLKPLARAKDGTIVRKQDDSIKGKLNIGQWLRGITQGTDYLTAMNWSDKKTKPELESLGSMGERKELVGQEHAPTATAAAVFKKFAPIFELRRMQQDVPHEEWAGLALDIFDYAKALNDLQNPTFKQDNRDGFENL